MKKSEMEQIKRLRFRESQSIDKESKIREEIMFLKNKIEEINKNKFIMKNHSESLFNNSMDNPDIQDYLHNLSIRESELEEEKNELINRIELLQNSLNIFRHSDENNNIERKRMWKYFGGENENNKL